MDAIDQLFGNKPVQKTASKTNVPSTKKVDAIDALFSSGTPTGLPYVPQSQQPVVEPKKTLGQKISKTAVDIGKAIVSPVATMVARPIQLGANLAGVPTENIDKFTLGGLIAPTPKNYQDVTKDIGRGIQTALTGGLGGVASGAIKGASLARTAGLGAIEGAGFGLGASMEQGNDILSPETAKQVALGGGIGAIAPVVLSGIGKAVSKKATPIVEQAIETPIESTVTKAVTPEVKPKPKVKEFKKTVQPNINETVEYKTKQERRKKTLDEDPIFESTKDKNAVRVAAYDRIRKEVSTDELSDIIYGRNNKPLPSDLDIPAAFKLLREEASINPENFSPKQIQRLANKYPASMQGSLLQSLQTSKTGIKNNAFDIIDETNQKIKDQIKEAKYTSKSVTKFLDDIEC